MKRKYRNRLVSEQLEDRVVMAGDVSLAAGVLTINMDATAPPTLTVQNSGPYVYITGNAEFGPRFGDLVRTTDVRHIQVIGTHRSEEINLALVTRGNYPHLIDTRVEAGAGDDKVHGSAVTDFILGQAGNDTIHGNNGNDQLRGNKGNDRIYGGNGSDTLRGGKGDDLLWGAPYHADDRAVDYAFGGVGYDSYGFANAYVGLNDVLDGIEKDLRRFRR